MSQAGDDRGGGLPPFWWVWVIGGVVVALAVGLFLYRFLLLDPVPVPGAPGAGPP